MNKWLKKGNAWYQAKDFKEAYVSYKKALKEDPNNPEILEKFGDALYNLERYLEAINYYNQAIKIMSNPESFLKSFQPKLF